MSEWNTQETALLKDERWDNFSQYLSQSKKTFPVSQNIAQALLENPGRFRSPLSFWEKIQLKLFASSVRLDFFQFAKNFSFTPSLVFIPHSWHVLLRYLKREGIVESAEIVPCMLLNDVPKNYFFQFISAPSSLTGKRYPKSVRSWGSSLYDMETAISKAVGELLERFFLSSGPNKEYSSITKLNKAQKNFLHPQTLSHFSEEQKKKFPRFRFSSYDEFAWVESWDIFSQKKILIPAQCVFRGYEFFEIEPVLRDPNSNGCAGHFTLQEAVLAGIYENVERDAFLIYWLNSIAPPVIDIESIENEELQNLITQLKRYHFEVKFLNTTTDIGIPSFLCVLIDRSSKGPRVAVGGGSGWNPIKTMVETGYKTLISFQSAQLRKVPEALSEDYIPFSDRSLRRENRVLLWMNPAMFSKIEFFFSGKEQQLKDAFPMLPVFTSLQEEYTHVMDIFSRMGKGYEIYFYQARHRVLNTISYRVVKVIIPELLHLYLNEAFPPLGAARLKTVPLKLGQSVTSIWNPLPHPFP